jgi:xylan 1,4-beta-xylosidase
MTWTEDGWIRLESGSNTPLTRIPAPPLPECKWPSEPVRDDFNSEVLNHQFQTLRVPLDEKSMSLVERPGYLRLKGGESLNSLHNQSLIARRQQSFRYQAETCVEFSPETFQQMAGLICIYDTMNFYYLHLTHDEKLGKALGILICNNGAYDFPTGDGISLDGVKKCYLRVHVDYDRLRFSYSVDGEAWIDMGYEFDATILSDEYYGYAGEERFTGAFTGLCCQDLTGRRICADFDYFEYVEADHL